MYVLYKRDFTLASSALGSTAPDIEISSLGPLHLATIPKTLFSMVTPEVKDILKNKSHVKSVALFGIEVSRTRFHRKPAASFQTVSGQAHVCVLQTALDLIDLGYNVHLIADGVSSCNIEEVPIALNRIRQAGGQITTSESVAFQLQRKLRHYL